MPEDEYMPLYFDGSFQSKRDSVEGFAHMLKLLLTLILLSGCAADGDAVKPFTRSLTYAGKSPIVSAAVGSSFSYDVRDEFGDLYQELYEVQPDHTVRLVTRFKYSRAM